MKHTIYRPAVAVAAIATTLLVGGVYVTGNSKASQGTFASTATPAIPVTVQTLAPQEVRAWSEFSGRLHAVDQVALRPEVGGRVTAVKFEDGQNVKAGDVLFIIDPRPYEAAVAKAEANLASARNNAHFAKLEWDRAAGLKDSEAIAQRVYDERANAGRVADAAVQAAEAVLKQAQLDLEHAYVRAPIGGRASRAEITLGNLVQAGPGAPLLTTIVANQSIYADFEVDEQTYLQSIRQSAGAPDQARTIPVQISVQDDKGHAYQGHIDSFDNHLDTTTGTIRARARFDNADGALVPGMFVSVRLANAQPGKELLIPNKALGFDQSKKFVYVVGDDNRVAYREVELGKQIDARRVALKGVQAGERIIVDGLQHVRPEAVVAPREYAADTPQKTGDNR